jgi:hypothetical protein
MMRLTLDAGTEGYAKKVLASRCENSTIKVSTGCSRYCSASAIGVVDIATASAIINHCSRAGWNASASF